MVTAYFLLFSDRSDTYRTLQGTTDICTEPLVRHLRRSNPSGLSGTRADAGVTLLKACRDFRLVRRYIIKTVHYSFPLFWLPDLLVHFSNRFYLAHDSYFFLMCNFEAWEGKTLCSVRINAGIFCSFMRGHQVHFSHKKKNSKT